MKKATPVEWVETNEFSGLGHGVEFHHRDYPDSAVAFAEGFRWSHEPGTQVTVRVLATACAGVSDADWTAILDDVRTAVTGYFSKGSKTGNASKPGGIVRAWING